MFQIHSFIDVNLLLLHLLVKFIGIPSIHEYIAHDGRTDKSMFGRIKKENSFTEESIALFA